MRIEHTNGRITTARLDLNSRVQQLQYAYILEFYALLILFFRKFPANLFGTAFGFLI